MGQLENAWSRLYPQILVPCGCEETSISLQMPLFSYGGDRLETLDLARE